MTAGNDMRLYFSTSLHQQGLLLTLLTVLVFFYNAPLSAQDIAAQDPEPLIEANIPAKADADIAARIREIYSQVDELKQVTVSVKAGVVELAGSAISADASERAESLAIRVEGVVTVENNIQRDVSIGSRVNPTLHRFEDYANNTIKLLPLITLSIVVFIAIIFVGWLLAGWSALWQRLSPNLFIAELVATTLRAIFIVLATISALTLLDATALLGAFLGAAGVLGLAVGFAVRDTIENYISSIMLSLRQPFRPNEHVVIDGHEGHVIRLTSRATILMTMDGNHLRIPNSSVFKAVILNYSRNPERRFEFELGVDADDDPLAAIDVALNTIKELDFILEEPTPLGYVKNVGDSNIVIVLTAWIDQRSSSFVKCRSVALSAAKNALEGAGFALPEPIYRLRFDDSNSSPLKAVIATENDRQIEYSSSTGQQPTQEAGLSTQALDTAPDKDIAEKVEEERRESSEADLLSHSAPIE